MSHDRRKLWSRYRDEKQWRLAAALGERVQEVKRGWIGPLQILEGEDSALGSRSRENPGGHRRQLSSPQLLGLQSGVAVLRQWDVDERSEQRRVFRSVEANQPQRALKIGEALLSRRIRAKS